jgi:hypothetical protein
MIPAWLVELSPRRCSATAADGPGLKPRIRPGLGYLLLCLCVLILGCDLAPDEQKDDDPYFILLTAPEEGTRLQEGQSLRIEWIAPQPNGIVIELYKNGSLCEQIAWVHNTDHYNWTVGRCGGPSTEYTLRVRHGATTGKYDEHRVTIAVPCEVLVVSPGSWESVTAGEDFTILWVTEGGNCASSVRIDLYHDGTRCRTIIPSTPNDGEHIWRAEKCGSDDSGYQVVISTPSGVQGWGDSFSFEPPPPERFRISPTFAANLTADQISRIREAIAQWEGRLTGSGILQVSFSNDLILGTEANQADAPSVTRIAGDPIITGKCDQTTQTSTGCPRTARIRFNADGRIPWNWSASAPRSDQVDGLSCALHELGHAVGFFNEYSLYVSHVRSIEFGLNAVQCGGRQVILINANHVNPGTAGQEQDIMVPSLGLGVRQSLGNSPSVGIIDCIMRCYGE